MNRDVRHMYSEQDMEREKRKRRSILAQREKMSKRVAELEAEVVRLRGQVCAHARGPHDQSCDLVAGLEADVNRLRRFIEEIRRVVSGERKTGLPLAQAIGGVFWAFADQGHVYVPADGDGGVDKRLGKMMDEAPDFRSACMGTECGICRGPDGDPRCPYSGNKADGVLATEPADFRFEFEGEICADLKALIGEGELFENVKTVVQAKLDRVKADAAGHARKFTEEDKGAARSAIVGRIPVEAAEHPEEFVLRGFCEPEYVDQLIKDKQTSGKEERDG